MKTFFYADGSLAAELKNSFEEMGCVAEIATEVMGDAIKVQMSDEKYDLFKKSEMFGCAVVTDTAEEMQKIWDEVKTTDIYVVGGKTAQDAIDELSKYFRDIHAVDGTIAHFKTEMSYEEAEQFCAGFGFLCGNSLEDAKEYLQ